MRSTLTSDSFGDTYERLHEIHINSSHTKRRPSKTFRKMKTFLILKNNRKCISRKHKNVIIK